MATKTKTKEYPGWVAICIAHGVVGDYSEDKSQVEAAAVYHYARCGVNPRIFAAAPKAKAVA